MLTGNFKLAYDLIMDNTNLSLRFQKAGRKEKKEIENKIQANIDLMKKIDFEVGTLLTIIKSDQVKELAKSKFGVNHSKFVITEEFLYNVLKENNLVD
jgi:predicted AlkP superfamily phosphohydrolase/phosphomutase